MAFIGPPVTTLSAIASKSEQEKPLLASTIPYNCERLS